MCTLVTTKIRTTSWQEPRLKVLVAFIAKPLQLYRVNFAKTMICYWVEDSNMTRLAKLARLARLVRFIRLG